MTARRWVSKKKPPVLPAVPESTRMKKARGLEMPGPGIVVTVPLSILPEYLELYGLEPISLGEVNEADARLKRRQVPGILVWVKRTKKEGQHAH